MKVGTLGPGVVRTIGLSARVTQTGTYNNCATVVGEGGDTNSANNRDCAETLVTAPLTPPVTPAKTPKPQPKAKPTPKPKPAPNLCRVLTINTKLVKANGAAQAIVAKVTRSRNPVRGVKVRFTGAGVNADLVIEPVAPGETLSIVVSVDGSSAVLEATSSNLDPVEDDDADEVDDADTEDDDDTDDQDDDAGDVDDDDDDDVEDDDR